MKLLRIISKENSIFIRDDFKFDSKTEIALDVQPASGFAWPLWDGSKWIESPESLRPIPPLPFIQR